MAGKGSKNHIHKYYRARVAGVDVWACGLDNCTHYMPKHLEELVPGKVTVCWSCDKRFMLDERAMKYERPICLDCELKQKTDGALDLEGIEKLLQQ